MDTVEKLGNRDGQQAFRVSVGNSTEIVFYNDETGEYNCAECQFVNCIHIQQVQMFLENSENKFKWMDIIAYTLEHHSTTTVRALWQMVSKGKLLRRNLDKKHIEMIIENINDTLKSMKLHEVAYLTLLEFDFEDFGIDTDFFEPTWYNARQWLYESRALEVYMNTNCLIFEGTKIEDAPDGDGYIFENGRWIDLDE